MAETKLLSLIFVDGLIRGLSGEFLTCEPGPIRSSCQGDVLAFKQRAQKLVCLGKSVDVFWDNKGERET
jgi:hypothetical protein